MILGLGVDLVEVSRIRNIWHKYGSRFLKRICTPKEISLALSRPDPALYLSALFAAKEATSKALGTGIKGISWREMEVCHEKSGKPLIYLYGKAQEIFKSLGGKRILISLSHERSYAMATVIIEGGEK